ncbi:MAG: sugar phosphate nucleotidyltransferase [bacterium]
MKTDKTLLIMAAGMGSRFGGLKQIESVGQSGEFIIDYSIYDAIQAGFSKVVFVIKEENLSLFEETVGNRLAEKIKVEYAFQSLEDTPIKIDQERVKPWGTAHAIMAARNNISGPFLVINADDFYGRDAFIKASEHLTKSSEYFIIGYKVINTLSESGEVCRGICDMQNGVLKCLNESKCSMSGNDVLCTPLSNKEESFIISNDVLCSTNMIGFNANFFPFLENKFKLFLEKNKDYLATCEYMIPDVLTKVIEEKYNDVLVIKTDSKWLGITFKEDLEGLKGEINKLIENGEYPKNLWGK